MRLTWSLKGYLTGAVHPAYVVLDGYVPLPCGPSTLRAAALTALTTRTPDEWGSTAPEVETLTQ